jgi:hypothetical protein
VSADHDRLMRTARQLIATRIAMVHTLEARRQDMEKRVDDSEARLVRTRHLLTASTALLQQAKASRYDRLPARPTGPHENSH